MKTIHRRTISFAITFIVIIALTCFNSFNSAAQTVLYNISGNAEGAQVVPAVSGNGTGAIAGTYNPSTKILDYYSNWKNLTGAPVSAAFYIGAPGSIGKPFSDPWTFGTNNRPDGQTTGKLTLTADQEKELLAGNWYYIYATDIYTKGEIRGQIRVQQSN